MAHNRMYMQGSNAEHIRSMTDEELAELFSHLCCPYSLGGEIECNIENRGCYECWYVWLQQEEMEDEYDRSLIAQNP